MSREKKHDAKRVSHRVPITELPLLHHALRYAYNTGDAFRSTLPTMITDPDYKFDDAVINVPYWLYIDGFGEVDQKCLVALKKDRDDEFKSPGAITREPLTVGYYGNGNDNNEAENRNLLYASAHEFLGFLLIEYTRLQTFYLRIQSNNKLDLIAQIANVLRYNSSLTALIISSLDSHSSENSEEELATQKAQAIKALAVAIYYIPTLTAFAIEDSELSYNEFDTLATIAQAHEAKSLLQSVTLSNVFQRENLEDSEPKISQVSDIFFMNLCHQITELNLRMNTFPLGFINALGKTLEKSSSLQSLILNGNRDDEKVVAEEKIGLGDENAIELLRALSNNSSLTLLNLTGNGLTDAVDVSLAQLVLHHPVLKRLYLNKNPEYKAPTTLFAALCERKNIESLFLSAEQWPRETWMILTDLNRVNLLHLGFCLNLDLDNDPDEEMVVNAKALFKIFAEIILSTSNFLTFSTLSTAKEYDPVLAPKLSNREIEGIEVAHKISERIALNRKNHPRLQMNWALVAITVAYQRVHQTNKFFSMTSISCLAPTVLKFMGFASPALTIRGGIFEAATDAKSAGTGIHIELEEEDSKSENAMQSKHA